MRRGDEWCDPGEAAWMPAASESLGLEVDWSPPSVVGVLWLPDGTSREVFEERPVFGFARES